MLHFVLVLFFTSFSNLPSFGTVHNEMYIGVENTIHIQLNNCNPEDIQIKVSQGTLQKRSDSTYVYIAQGINEEIKFKLYYKKVLCGLISATTTMLPIPTIALEKEKDGTMKLKDFNDLIQLQFVYPPSFPEKHKSKILSFSLVIYDKNNVPVHSQTIRGDAFDENTMKGLTKLTKGCTMNIHNILTSNVYKGNTLFPGSKQILITE